MHTYVRTLQTISSRYAPSRILSFDIAHIFKALQIIEDRGHASRTLLCQELNLGEGAVRTLIKHLKMKELIETSNAGTKMSDKGKKFFAEILTCLPKGCSLPKCSIALGKYNYVVLLKQFSFAVKSGIEQRDASIKMGALGATTLLFSKGKFVMPNTNIMLDPLKKEPSIYELLVKKLEPVEGDVIIIGSDDINRQTAELAAKNAALLTLINHKKHTK
jgi:predicted transcriptional regulator